MSVLAFKNPETFEPLNLQPLLQAALIQMTESQVKRTIVRRLTEDMQCGPSVRTYEELVTRGLAELRPGQRWHSLTFEGREVARKLIPYLCKVYDIHLLIEGGGGRYTVDWYCPCGWQTQTDKGNFTTKNARFRFDRHLLQVAADNEPRWCKMARGEAS